MIGRMTEAELRELDRAAEYESRNRTRPIDWTAESLRLVAEVRRLRGLILRGVEVRIYSEMQMPGGQAAWDALEAEARAIREEEGLT